MLSSSFQKEAMQPVTVSIPFFGTLYAKFSTYSSSFTMKMGVEHNNCFKVFSVKCEYQ